MLSNVNREAALGLTRGNIQVFLDRLRGFLSEAKTSGNLTTWLTILLSFTVTVATVFLAAGRVIDRLESLDETIKQQDRLQIERDNNQAQRIAELEKRQDKLESKNEKFDTRLTNTRELVIASGGKLVPAEKAEKEE